jgi:ankyrin repeat protein
MSIFRAISLGDANEVMRLLNTDPSLLEGVDMSGGTYGYRMTPLIQAARAGQLEIVKLLIGKGADIHATTSRSETALHWAASRGHEEVVAYLLDNGAQTSHQDSIGHTPLMSAVKNGRTRVALRILDYMGGQGLEACCPYGGYTALHLAIFEGLTDLVAVLLTHGAYADTTSRGGTSALQTAVGQGHLEIVKLLVDSLGPQALHQVDPRRGSLLHIALNAYRRMSEGMVIHLLSKGPWPTVRDGRGETALMCGARSASIKVLRRLLDHTAGQGLNDRSSDGKTALHYAVLHNRPENVRALLQAGADPAIGDDLQWTPRMLVQQGTAYQSSAEVFKVRECTTHDVRRVRVPYAFRRRRTGVLHPVCHVPC